MEMQFVEWKFNNEYLAIPLCEKSQELARLADQFYLTTSQIQRLERSGYEIINNNEKIIRGTK